LSTTETRSRRKSSANGSNSGYTVEQLKVKNWLDKHGIKDYELVTVTLSDIDRDESLRNQSRVSTPVIGEAVERYATAMKKGDVFPPVVTFSKPPRSKKPHDVLIDGNQRYHAAEAAGKNSLETFRLNGISERDITILTFAANVEHGMPSSEKDRMVHAEYLVETAGLQSAEAARMLGLAENKVQKMMHTRQLEKRLVELGVRQSFTPRTKERLAAVRNDVVLLDVVDFIYEYQVDDYELSPVVTKINKKRNEADQLEVLNEERAIRGPSKKTATPEPKSARSLNSVLGRLLSFDPARLENSKMSDEYKDMLLERITAALDHLKAVKKSI
jgi:hypothetical protein